MTIREQLQEKLEKGQIDPLTFLKANIQLTGVEEKIELIKGGEGSKGGHVIGHTRTGKAIYNDSRHESHDDFTGKDHADAALVEDQKDADPNCQTCHSAWWKNHLSWG